MSNAFSTPFMTLVVYAFLADHYSNTFAKVLFWAGAGPMLALSVVIVGEWLSRLRHEGQINGSMQMTPVRGGTRAGRSPGDGVGGVAGWRGGGAGPAAP